MKNGTGAPHVITGETRDPSTLRPHPRNTRKHSPQQVDMIVASLEQFGFAKAVLIDDHDTIIAGHGAVLAAVQMKLAEIPVGIAVGWSEENKRAYLIADNRLGERSRWDYGLLAVELESLKKIVDVKALGFTKAELTTALRRSNSEPAAVGQLGAGLQYRVIVDCTDEKHQAQLLERFAKEGLACHALIS